MIIPGVLLFVLGFIIAYDAYDIEFWVTWIVGWVAYLLILRHE